MNLRNQPVTKKQVKDLPLGLHLHSYPNRRARRMKGETANNRKSGKGRLVSKQIVFTKEYNELIKERSNDSTTYSRMVEIGKLLYNGFGKLRLSMYKTIIRENRQITYTPLELKQIAEGKARMIKLQEAIGKKASSDAKGL